jgi:uncharacterized membrane protein
MEPITFIVAANPTMPMEDKMKKVPWVLAIAGIVVLFVSQLRFSPSLGGAAVISSAAVPVVMQVIISVVVLAAGLYVALSGKYQAAEKNWAFGIIGTIVGFWLKAPH